MTAPASVQVWHPSYCTFNIPELNACETHYSKPSTTAATAGDQWAMDEGTLFPHVEVMVGSAGRHEDQVMYLSVMVDGKPAEVRMTLSEGERHARQVLAQIALARQSAAAA